MFFRSCDFIFNFFGLFSKSAPEYFVPSGNFVFNEILCSSNFFGRTIFTYSPRLCSRGSPGGCIFKNAHRLKRKWLKRALIFWVHFGIFSMMGKIFQKPLCWSFHFKIFEEVSNGANYNKTKLCSDKITF